MTANLKKTKGATTFTANENGTTEVVPFPLDLDGREF
jgi:hypothetical protein